MSKPPPETLDQRRARISSDLANVNPKLHRHLFGKAPKRMLALDGGGVLGVIEIAFLERIETELRKRHRNSRLVLSDYFDLIGGTSTGAIIASGLAMGMTVAQVRAHYFTMAENVFSNRRIRFAGLEPKFDARKLTGVLRGVFGERQLQTSDLETGLAIVSKRVDTGSPWVLSNNPMSKYWEDPEIRPGRNAPDYIGNKRYKLSDLIRASTAAPYYYSPKEIEISVGAKGLFVDGGVTPHNNPALQMLMLANIRGYGFQWQVDPDNLLLLSVGCGWIRPRIKSARLLDRLTAPMAVKTLQSVIWDSQVNTLKILQWISEPRRPWPINTEVGTLEKEFLGLSFGSHQELLKFQRYDVMLDPNEEHQARFGPAVDDATRERLKNFMDPSILREAYELGRECAKLQVDPNDFPERFDLDVAQAEI